MPITTKGETLILAQAPLTTTHVMRINSLQEGSIYVIRLKGRDQYGNEAVSDPVRYVTGKDTRPPVISNTQVEAQMTGSGAAATSQVVITWQTDEPATTQVIYGPGVGTDYPHSTPEERGLTKQHTVVIRDMQNSTSYHLQIVTKDEAGNMAKSSDLIVVTPATTESALDVVLKNLESVFGFLQM